MLLLLCWYYVVALLLLCHVVAYIVQISFLVYFFIKLQTYLLTDRATTRQGSYGMETLTLAHNAYFIVNV